MKVFLCGYDWIGCRVLDYLMGVVAPEDLAVFTHHPSVGTPSLIQYARAASVWAQTEDVNRVDQWPFLPDIIASIYYRTIFSPATVSRVGGKIFNLHPSLLPKYRGCSSLTWAIFNGESHTGITYHYVDEGVDTGNVILQATITILAEETQATLYSRAMSRGLEFFPAALSLVANGFVGGAQIGTATYYRRGVPFSGEIDPSWDEEKVERFIRAMTRPPLPYARFLGHEIQSMKQYQSLKVLYQETVAEKLR